MAAVELRLDGRKASLLGGPPWTGLVDLGPLAPHELTAIALDEKSRELARARQWINMPRPPAEAEILLERNAAGLARAARIAWKSINGEDPKHIQVSFDGRPIAIDGLGRAVIPAYAPEISHILTVELEFESGMKSRDDIAIGGGAGADAEGELTAVPVRTARGKLPALADLQGALRSRERALRVTAAEEGEASLWIVRDESPVGIATRLRRANSPLPLGKEDSVRFLWPRPVVVPRAEVPTSLFPSSQEFRRSNGGLALLLGEIYNSEPGGIFPTYADAVAVAGLNAFESYQRRAVLLVLAGESPDASSRSPQAVRSYLETLRVPLFVWSFGDAPPADSTWGAVESVRSGGSLRAAYARLREALDSQRILWVEGRYLPQEISLAQGAAGLELVR